MRVSTLRATAQMMTPKKATTLPPMKNQRLPKRSDRRPRIVYVKDSDNVLAMLTQEMYGLGPG